MVFGEEYSVRGMTLILGLSVHVFDFTCTRSVHFLPYLAYNELFYVIRFISGLHTDDYLNKKP